MLEIHLLGRFRLVAPSGALPPFPTRASKLLFSYLVLHRDQGQSRERLCTLLAGNCPERAARRKLRQELWRVKTTLAVGDPERSLLEVDGHWIGLNPGTELWVDVEQFELAVRRADRLASPDPRLLASLEFAYQAYAGPLLDGEYEPWCSIEQDRFRAMHHEITERLVALYAGRGEWHRALRCARDLLRYDPLVEHVHRQVMALLYLVGDRPGALHQFHECRQILLTELASEPMGATLRVMQALKDEDHRVLLQVLGLEQNPVLHGQAVPPPPIARVPSPLIDRRQRKRPETETAPET